MKRTPNLFRLCSCVAVSFLVSVVASAQVPQLLNFQGRITVGNVNFDGTGQFKFALVNGSGSLTFWSNDGTGAGGGQPAGAVSVPVSKGLYSVQLGNTALPNMIALPAAVFTNSDLRLRVWFNDGATGFQLFTPDQRLAAVGYAMMAGNVPDGTVTVAKLATDVRAGLGTPSSGSTVFSADPNATTLLAAGYVKLPGLRLLAEEWEVLGADTNVQFSSMSKSPIWTGSEAYVFRADSATGGPLAVRYNPTSNIWHTVNTNGLPVLTSFIPVWIGTELMILTSNPGQFWAARYDPNTEVWHSVNTIGAPALGPTTGSVIFWTGTELIVMTDNGPSAKRYHPSTDTWVSVNTNGAPFIGGPGIQAVAWTGTELILNYGSQLARYNPTSDSWPAITTNGMPALSQPSSRLVWCGDTLIALTNNGSYSLGGGRYSPALNSWQPVTTNGAPAFTIDNTSTRTLWTGSELIVFNTTYMAGYLYNPAANAWRQMNPSMPSAISYMGMDTNVFWTGTEMVLGPLLAGATSTGLASDRYNPATDRWLSIAALPINMMNRVPGVIWTGTQALTFAGNGAAPTQVQYVIKWSPSPTLYLYQKP